MPHASNQRLAASSHGLGAIPASVHPSQTISGEAVTLAPGSYAVVDLTATEVVFSDLNSPAVFRVARSFVLVPVALDDVVRFDAEGWLIIDAPAAHKSDSRRSVAEALMSAAIRGLAAVLGLSPTEAARVFRRYADDICQQTL